MLANSVTAKASPATNPSRHDRTANTVASISALPKPYRCKNTMCFHTMPPARITSAHSFASHQHGRCFSVGYSPSLTRHGRRRPAVAASAAASATVTESQGLEVEIDGRGEERIKLQQAGWKYWEWRGSSVHYIQAGAAAMRNMLHQIDAQLP